MGTQKARSPRPHSFHLWAEAPRPRSGLTKPLGFRVLAHLQGGVGGVWNLFRCLWLVFEAFLFMELAGLGQAFSEWDCDNRIAPQPQFTHLKSGDKATSPLGCCRITGARCWHVCWKWV